MKMKVLKFSTLFFAACVSVQIEAPDISCDFDAEAACAECGSNSQVYYCECWDDVTDEFVVYGHDPSVKCSSSTNHCAQCPAGTHRYPGSFQCPMEDTPTDGNYNCGDWDPGDMIFSSSANNYGILNQLVASVQYDVTPLYECDSARINAETGHLIVEDAVSTDMVYLLGLRNGDRLVEMNGMSIDDPLLAGTAYAELVDQGELEFTLKVLRSSSYVYINYEIIAMSP